MGKEKHKKPQAVPQVTPSDYCLEDKPTKLSHPFVRIAFNFFAVVLLGKDFTSISNAYFTSVIMFASPLLLEYMAFVPSEEPRKMIKRVQKGMLTAVCAIGIVGWFGILCISPTDGLPRIAVQDDYAFLGGRSIPALWLYLCLWAIFLLTCIDPFASTTKAEKKINNYAFMATTRDE